MRVFKSRLFAKFARKEHISDKALCKAITEMVTGKVAADYGGGLIKQRIARQGGGKSGGYRVIVLYHRGNKAFFVYGYAKKDQDNISSADEKTFKEMAKVMFAFTDSDLDNIVQHGAFEEIGYNDKEI